MEKVADIRAIDLAALKVLKYPDPRLTARNANVTVFDESLQALVRRMFEVMFEAKGVGLAAPQVGVPLRLFVASPTFEPSDLRVYANPRIIAAEGTQETEEGCLSLPGINCKIKRRSIVTIEAMDLLGKTFEETGEDLQARIYQHEIDHLDGWLLVDRMGSVAKLAHRWALKELQEQYAQSKG